MMNPKPRREYLDQDYIDKLNSKEKEFLSNFNDEFYGGDFTHEGKRLHKTKKLAKDCYDRNNSRNRDLYSISKAGDTLDSLPLGGIEEDRFGSNPKAVEEAVVDLIDVGENTGEEVEDA